MKFLIISGLSGAGSVPSSRAKYRAASKTAVCVTDLASICPWSYSSETMELMPW